MRRQFERESTAVRHYRVERFSWIGVTKKEQTLENQAENNRSGIWDSVHAD